MGDLSKPTIDYEKYVKYAQILEKTKWADEFSWDDIKKICHYIRPVSAQKGAVVFKEGAKEHSLGIIVKGSIDILKSSGDDAKKIATLKNSQTFGEMALLDGEPRSATGVANTDTIVAINTDPNAPIFKQCDYYIVGSAEQVVPELAEAIKAQ